MKSFHKFVICLGFLFCAFSVHANTFTLDFDSIDDRINWRHNYGGFKWEKLNSIDKNAYEKGGYQWSATSGDWSIFNSNALPATITRVEGGLFDFHSAYMTAAWNDDLNVTVEGWLGDTISFTKTVVLSTTSPLFIDFEFTNIDKLTFTSYGGTPNPLWDYTGGGHGAHFAMDDMTFTIHAVPEPTTLGMMLAGLAMIGFTARRRLALKKQ